MKSLDAKLKRITSGKYKPTDFIVADAKDPEMSAGVSSPGPKDLHDEGKGHHTVETFRQSIVDVVKQGVVDIMLVAASSLEAVSAKGVFKKSHVTPAIRANDATDIWRARGSSYAKEFARPFRTANLAHCKKFSDLGLYSVTFNNDLSADYAHLEAYNASAPKPQSSSSAISSKSSIRTRRRTCRLSRCRFSSMTTFCAAWAA